MALRSTCRSFSFDRTRWKRRTNVTTATSRSYFLAWRVKSSAETCPLCKLFWTVLGGLPRSRLTYASVNLRIWEKDVQTKSRAPLNPVLFEIGEGGAFNPLGDYTYHLRSLPQKVCRKPYLQFQNVLHLKNANFNIGAPVAANEVFCRLVRPANNLTLAQS